jgi:YegS/Rv2252/BmrU family lipid kinase
MAERERRALIVRNPNARRAYAGSELLAAAQPLRDLGWEVELETSAAPGDAAEIARRAATDRASVVVACGGDGTVHEVANGLMEAPLDVRPALAVVAAGTANVWAREAGVPRDLTAALMLVARGRRARMDLGTVAIGSAAARHFMLMCGVGLDAEVVRRVEARPERKRRLGRAAFVWPSLRAMSGSPVEAALAFDGETVRRRLLLAVAGNTRLYGGVVQLTGAARVDDGLLDLVLFHEAGGLVPGIVRRTGLALRALRGGIAGASLRGIEYRRVREVTIEPAAALPVQADGEYLGECSPGEPLHIGVVPGAIEVVMARRPTPLLGEAVE